jgi:hypothetical protein
LCRESIVVDDVVIVAHVMMTYDEEIFQAEEREKQPIATKHGPLLVLHDVFSIT